MGLDDDTELARTLPGRWTVKATNFPLWLGDRRDATVEFGIQRETPLTLGVRFAYLDPDGKPKTVTSTDRWNGGGFSRRVRGLRGMAGRGRWEVAGAQAGVVVVRFEKTVASPSGLDVLVAEGADGSDLRARVAADPAAFGLRVEEFASLTWLDHLPPSG
jgi:hypothetical protein